MVAWRNVTRCTARLGVVDLFGDHSLVEFQQQELMGVVPNDQ